MHYHFKKLFIPLAIGILASSAIAFAASSSTSSTLPSTTSQIQSVDGQTPPEPPKDENGNPLPPTDKQSQTKDHKGQPPEPPKDANGNPLPPPSSTSSSTAIAS